ncbi:class I SAM-dependent methyltransferase [Streptomyces carminius]|uniref:Class I SAM-dependent methyltransferase n=1 Tax=Streptomyces carminius TaxID=2665496 RepID=A0A2M8LTU5_9ACTN|nr:methyltransferase domain-containing protein [Streptomyces carminius]PJE95374.1 class I SAM-dependent methyltransferase [Streptomyces carminius]
MTDHTGTAVPPAPTPTPTPADVGRLYDRSTGVVDSAANGNIHSGYWEDDTDRSSLTEATDRLTDLVADRLAASPGERLLDVGCGTGRPALRVAAARGVLVEGISVSREEVEAARAHAGEGGLADRVAFGHTDVMELPFAAESFDGAWAIESLMHMSDRAGALSRIARTLRPGGRLVVADVLLRRPVTGEVKEFVDHMCLAFQAPWLPGPGEYREAVRQAGLELLEFSDIGEHVRRTYREFAAALGEAGAHGGDGPGGGEAEGDIVGSADALPRFGELPEIGYVLLVARRPVR